MEARPRPATWQRGGRTSGSALKSSFDGTGGSIRWSSCDCSGVVHMVGPAQLRPARLRGPRCGAVALATDARGAARRCFAWFARCLALCKCLGGCVLWECVDLVPSRSRGPSIHRGRRTQHPTEPASSILARRPRTTHGARAAQGIASRGAATASLACRLVRKRGEEHVWGRGTQREAPSEGPPPAPPQTPRVGLPHSAQPHHRTCSPSGCSFGSHMTCAAHRGACVAGMGGNGKRKVGGDHKHRKTFKRQRRGQFEER